MRDKVDHSTGLPMSPPQMTRTLGCRPLWPPGLWAYADTRRQRAATVTVTAVSPGSMSRRLTWWSNFSLIAFLPQEI
jgi:hypothetical protein